VPRARRAVREPADKSEVRRQRAGCVSAA
jgi:hypothetical protein